MEQVPCLGCGLFFTPRNKKQNYCSAVKCQRTRKADWQRHKLKTDPDYKRDQRISQKKWLSSNRGYWKSYRLNNREKAERNRALQRLRNKSRLKKVRPGKAVIAKMDVRKDTVKPVDIMSSGQFWLVPVIAKMDAAKVFLRVM